MFADRAKILSAPVRAETDMSASAGSCTYPTAVRTAVTADAAAM